MKEENRHQKAPFVPARETIMGVRPRTKLEIHAPSLNTLQKVPHDSFLTSKYTNQSHQSSSTPKLTTHQYIDNNTQLSPQPIYTFCFPSHLNGMYRYTKDLLALDACRPDPTDPRPPQELRPIITPLNPVAWAQELVHMPDKQLVSYLLTGIQFGFRVGYNRHLSKLVSAKTNMQSALLNRQPVQEFLTKESLVGRLLGPFNPHLMPSIHTSRFGVIPKRSQPGKWRLTLDLSSPDGHSVNDGISSDICSMSYASVDHAAQIISQLGQDALMAKIDIAHAYRNVPVHPEDRYLLGMQWDCSVYIDSVLSFGLRSAPKIFSSLSDTLEWIFRHNQVQHILHYLDDFFTAGTPDTDQCKQHLDTIISICQKLGFPLATDKIEGPSTLLVFLGILLDSHLMQMRLPEQKLQELKAMVAQWLE